VNETHAFLKQDLERARWLQNQIDCDIAYAEAVCNRVLESYKVTNLRLEQVSQANTQRQHQLELTQTVLLGALLTCLNAIMAFQAKVPIPVPLRWPVIALLIALAVAIPPFLLHWKDGYGMLEYIGASFIGGSAAWIVVTKVSQQNLHPFGLRLVLALALFLFPIAVVWSLGRLQRRHRRKL